MMPSKPITGHTHSMHPTTPSHPQDNICCYFANLMGQDDTFGIVKVFDELLGDLGNEDVSSVQHNVFGGAI